jgi:hypothetical protein
LAGKIGLLPNLCSISAQWVKITIREFAHNFDIGSLLHSRSLPDAIAGPGTSMHLGGSEVNLWGPDDHLNCVTIMGIV